LKTQIRGKKGITLIALVITIIVLLILAGITVITLTGDNGLIKKTGDAKEQYNNSAIKEQIDLAKTYLNMEGKLINATNIKEYLVENNIYSDTDVNITSKDENTSVLEIGKISEEFPKSLVIVYFQKADNWNDGDVYAYVWDNEKGIEYKSWPGEKLEIVDQTNQIYKYQIPDIFYNKNIVFNNGDSTQTVDLRLPKNNSIFKVRNAFQSRTVYYVTRSNEEARIHMWKKENGNVVATTQWPGIAMTFVKKYENNDTFYRYEIPAEYDSFCFAEVNENNTVVHQTHDISYNGGDVKYYSTGNEYYKNVNISIYSDGTWEQYNY